MQVRPITDSESLLLHTLPTPNTMEHREIKTPEEIEALKVKSPGGYRNLREVVINELPEDSLLRTPSVTDGTGGAISETQARERGRMVKVADQVAELAFENDLKVSDSIAASLFSTPTTMDAKATNDPEIAQKFLDADRQTCLTYEVVLMPTPAVAHVRNHDEPIEDYLQRRQDFIDGKTKGMPGASLGVAVRMEMLPTPAARDFKDGQAEHTRDGVVQTDTVARAVFNSGEVTLLNTPQVDDAKNTGHNQDRRTTLASEVWLAETTTNWGKFTAAIERWEAITRPAPAPTKPDGKDGAHRLSAEFTEWMMGLPEGWVTSTEIGLKRNDQLKACGNGVVPQQAEMALAILIDDQIMKQLGK